MNHSVGTKKIENLFNKAFESNSQMMMISSGLPPRMKRLGSWISLEDKAWSDREMRNELLSLLDDDEKKQLQMGNNWSGVIHFSKRPVLAQVQMTLGGFLATFKWSSNQKFSVAAFGLQQSWIETLKKTKGGHFIVGPKESGKTTYLQMLAGQMAEDLSLSCFFYSGNHSTQFSDKVVSFDISNFSKERCRSADYIFIDEPSVDRWSDILDLMDSGFNVIVSFAAYDINSFLQRWQSYHLKNYRQAINHINSVFGMRLISGLENQLVSAQEILFLNEDTRMLMTQGKWGQITEQMQINGEKSGTRTMNQSLLQLLLRRRIDLKTAFLETNNPEEFDQMLKRVGV